MAQQPHQLKKAPTDQWSVREKLALASSVERTPNQNWVSVSRQIKSFAEPNRPPDWFSQKNCALQYGSLLEDVEHPKRKRGEEIATPGSLIVKKLTQERIAELEKLIVECNARHQKLRKELDLITAGRMDDKIDELIDELNKQAEDKARQEAAHQKWLKEREMEAERQRHLRMHMLANQKTKRQTRTISDASDSMQSDDSNLPGHCTTAPESPQAPQPPAAPTLLTTLLRSPSGSPNQSPRPSHAPSPAPTPATGAAPTSAGALQLPQPLSVGQRSVSTDSQHSGSATPVHTPISSQAPTLSPLLELPAAGSTPAPPAAASGDDRKPLVTIKTELLSELKQEVVDDVVPSGDRLESAPAAVDGPKVEPQTGPTQAQPTQPNQPQANLQQQSTATDRELDDALSVMVDVANGSQPALESVSVEAVPDSEIVSYIDEMRQDIEQGKVQPVVEEQQRKQMIAAQLRQSVEEVTASKAEFNASMAGQQVKQEPAEVEVEDKVSVPSASPTAAAVQPAAGANATPTEKQETKAELAPPPEETAATETKATRSSKPPSRESTPASTRVPSRSASPVRQKTPAGNGPSTPKPAVPPAATRASPAKEKEALTPIAKEKDGRGKMTIKVPPVQLSAAKEKVSTPPPKTPTKPLETAVLPVKGREAENPTTKAAGAPTSASQTPTRATVKTVDEEPAAPTPASSTATTTTPVAEPQPPAAPTPSEDRNEDTADDKSQCSNNTNVGDEPISGPDSQETESREDSVTDNSPAAVAAAAEEAEVRQEATPEEGKESKKKEPAAAAPASEAGEGSKEVGPKVETTGSAEEEVVDEMVEEEVSEDEDLGPDGAGRVVVEERDAADHVFKSGQSKKQSTAKDDDSKEDRSVASPEEEDGGTERSEERERDLKIWKRSALLIWRTAANHSHAAVFMAPVTDEMAPGYADIVYKPMDLTGIRRSIESGAIRTTTELLRDMMLMFQNAIMYNSADHDVYHKAIEMRFDVMKQIEEWMANEAAERGTGGTSPLLAGLSAALGVKRAARHRHSETIEPPAKKPRRSTGVGGAK